MDGIDAVLTSADAGPVLGHVHHPFSPALRETLLALNEPSAGELHRAAQAANALATGYAAAIRALLAKTGKKPAEITAAGCHGQTVRHRPDAGYSLQLLNGSLLAELTGITVVCDFRNRDIAAGGEGAPLVPAFHQAAFAHPQRSRAVINIGGMANITCLLAGGETSGFDCGPGNALLDGWIRETLGRDYDAGGTWAAEGKLLPELLERLLAHEFFERPPPKSTGREAFNLNWLRDALPDQAAPADVQATLCELTATSMARALDVHCADTSEVFLCGGGARNDFLRSRMSALSPQRQFMLTDELGITAEVVEAAAFAWLAARALSRQPGNLPRVTGASGPRVLGAIYPA